MNIIEAQYTRSPWATENENVRIVVENEGVNIEMFAPIKVGNRHYDEVMEKVQAGTLTIAEAE
jgi:hypothetical protein